MNNNIKVIHLLVLIQVYDIAATSLAFKTVLEQLMYFIDGQFFLFLLLVNFQNIFRHPKPNSFILCPCLLYVDIVNHTSKMNDLCSSLNSEEMLQNFLYLYKKKTQVPSLFGFSIWATFIFPFMNALVYFDIDQGIHKVKIKVAWNETQKR